MTEAIDYTILERQLAYIDYLFEDGGMDAFFTQNVDDTFPLLADFVSQSYPVSKSFFSR